MNLSILIGVSEYQNLTNLPGCKNDINYFKSLITETKKYDKKLVLEQNTNSSNVKSEIVKFINDNKNEPINEILFYFTGHGHYFEKEFYYILTDFDQNRKQQTSLQNTELDNLLKSLNPKLVTKVVDACESGFNYVKDIQTINTYIKSTQSNFNNCYFLFSSLNIQSSYQNQDFSFFTLSFLNSIKNYQNKVIRYKDIIDYISDEFIKISEQTPFFVVQADFTEVFCEKNEGVISFLSKVPPTFNEVIKPEKIINEREKSIEEIIKADSIKHLSKEQVLEFFEKIKIEILSFKPIEKYKNLYRFNIEFNQYVQNVVNTEIIGQYTSKHIEYYAQPTYETISYESVEKPSKIDMFTMFSQPYTVTKTKEKISGYELTTAYPYSQITMEIEGKYKNLISLHCSILFITTDRKIRFYWRLTEFIKKGWSKQEIDKRFNWNHFENEFIDFDNVVFNLQNINTEINNTIENLIAKIIK